MASTDLSLHYHVVFGTKNREPIIAPPWRSRLHEYPGGTISGLGGLTAARLSREHFPPHVQHVSTSVHWQSDRLLALLDRIEKQFSVHSDQMYVGRYSLGGSGV